MKAAFAHWDRRIAPVFDVARQIRLVEVSPGNAAREAQESLPEDLPVQKALRLAELGVDTLVCGAISRPLHEMILAYGIRVIPFVAGDLREVIQAWLGGGLDRNTFAMPGCCGRGRPRMRGQRGTGGTCVCTRCGHREAHERGVPCARRTCPKCGATMTRE